MNQTLCEYLEITRRVSEFQTLEARFIKAFGKKSDISYCLLGGGSQGRDGITPRITRVRLEEEGKGAYVSTVIVAI